MKASLCLRIVVWSMLCVGWLANCKNEQNQNGKLEGATLFRQLMFAHKEAADKVPELQRIREIAGLDQMDSARKVVASQMEDTIVAIIQKEFPPFMDEFGHLIQSGDPINVKYAIQQGGDKILAAIVILNHRFTPLLTIRYNKNLIELIPQRDKELLSLLGNLDSMNADKIGRLRNGLASEQGLILQLDLNTVQQVNKLSARQVDLQVDAEANVQTVRQVSLQTPQQTDLQTPRQLDLQTARLVDRQMERQVDLQVDLEAPRQTTLQTARQVDVQASRQTSSQIARQQSLQTPRQIDVQAPRQIDVQAPRQVALQTPRQVDLQTPRQIDLQTSSQVDVQTPRQVDIQTPRQIDVQAPRQLDVQTPRQLDLQTPRQVDVQTPRQVDLQTPRQIDVQAPKTIDLQTSAGHEEWKVMDYYVAIYVAAVAVVAVALAAVRVYPAGYETEFDFANDALFQEQMIGHITKVYALEERATNVR